MSEEIMASLPNSYLNKLFQKEHILELLAERGEINLEEFHEELKNDFGDGYDGWATE